MFVVIEGVDGTWKATQTRLLVKNLIKEGKSVGTLSFPMYDSWSSEFVRRFLRGEFGALDDIDPYIASTFYTLDRFAHKSNILGLINSKDVVVSDRYSTANFVHRGVKFLMEGESKKLQEFFDWLWEWEFERAWLPIPDLIIFLSLSMDNITNLLYYKMQQERNYIGAQLDIAESDVLHQKMAIKVWEEILPSYFANYVIVKWEDENGNLLTQEEMAQKVFDVVRSYLDNS